MTPSEIKQLRDRLGATQDEFAARIGVTAVTVSRWERGVRRPTSRAHLRALADALREIGKPSAEAEKQQTG